MNVAKGITDTTGFFEKVFRAPCVPLFARMTFTYPEIERATEKSRPARCPSATPPGLQVRAAGLFLAVSRIFSAMLLGTCAKVSGSME